MFQKNPMERYDSERELFETRGRFPDRSRNNNYRRRNHTDTDISDHFPNTSRRVYMKRCNPIRYANSQLSSYSENNHRRTSSFRNRSPLQEQYDLPHNNNSFISQDTERIVRNIPRMSQSAKSPSPCKTKIKSNSSIRRSSWMYPSNCLAVFGLYWRTTTQDLFEHFQTYGEVHSIYIKYGYGISRKPHRTYAFIYFKHTQDATRAREKLDKSKIHGFIVRVKYSITNYHTNHQDLRRVISTKTGLGLPQTILF